MDKPWTVKLHRDNDWEEWQVVVRRPDGSIDEGKTYYTVDGTYAGREDAFESMPYILANLGAEFGYDNVKVLKGRLTLDEFRDFERFMEVPGGVSKRGRYDMLDVRREES